MDAKGTSTAGDVALRHQIPAKAQPARAATYADVVSGAGTSAPPASFPASSSAKAEPARRATRSDVFPGPSVLVNGGLPSSSSARSASFERSRGTVHKFDEGPEPEEVPESVEVVPSGRKPRLHRPKSSDPDADGWMVVNSPKFRRIRGVSRDQVTPDAPVKVCDVEVPWGVMLGGDLRMTRKYYQGRASGTAMADEGLGVRTYGTYGPDGFEA